MGESLQPRDFNDVLSTVELSTRRKDCRKYSSTSHDASEIVRGCYKDYEDSMGAWRHQATRTSGDSQVERTNEMLPMRSRSRREAKVPGKLISLLECLRVINTHKFGSSFKHRLERQVGISPHQVVLFFLQSVFDMKGNGFQECNAQSREIGDEVEGKGVCEKRSDMGERLQPWDFNDVLRTVELSTRRKDCRKSSSTSHDANETVHGHYKDYEDSMGAWRHQATRTSRDSQVEGTNEMLPMRSRSRR